MVAGVTEADGRVYPRDRLEGCETALAGFCAGFLGRQDCAWLMQAGIVATCIDTDTDRLNQMAPLYPDSWTFVAGDIFDHAPALYRQGERFDVVTLDPPTSLFERCADTIELWTALANRIVVVGTGRHTDVRIPAGWRQTRLTRRSDFQGGVYWTVLEPA